MAHSRGKKSKSKEEPLLVRLFGDGATRDTKDWIPLLDTELEDLWNQQGSLSSMYRWLWALFFVERKKGSLSPKAPLSLMFAPFYLLPAHIWGTCVDFESHFKATVKTAQSKV
jgi:hypothetical protein